MKKIVLLVLLCSINILSIYCVAPTQQKKLQLADNVQNKSYCDKVKDECLDFFQVCGDATCSGLPFCCIGGVLACYGASPQCTAICFAVAAIAASCSANAVLDEQSKRKAKANVLMHRD